MRSRTLRAFVCWAPDHLTLTLQASGEGMAPPSTDAAMPPDAYVYILASQRNGTLYTGSTSDLSRRIWEHKTGAMPGFTKEYRVTVLVWYEGYPHISLARQREYSIKRWRRAWKLSLIEAMNPEWRDLYVDLNA